LLVNELHAPVVFFLPHIGLIVYFVSGLGDYISNIFCSFTYLVLFVWWRQVETATDQNGDS